MERCRDFMPVPGPFQTVQCAEFWEAILALTILMWSGPSVGCWIMASPLPFFWVKDWDLTAAVQHMIQARGAETVRVTKVTGHATEADVDQEDRLAHHSAAPSVHDSGFRVSVNHDGRGGTAPDPLVWDQGGRTKRRKADIRVNVDLAPLPGPLGFLHGSAFRFKVVVSLVQNCCMALQRQPYSASLLCKFISSFGALHWPSGAKDMGHFGISHL